VEHIMHARKALAATLAVGMAIGPTTAAVVTLGALVSPAVAQGGGHGRGHHATTSRGNSRRDGGSSTSTEARTITLHGIITGTPTATSLVITRVVHERSNCLVTPTTQTIILDSNTAFSTLSKPHAALGDLTTGDTVAVTLNVPAGTAPLTLAATSVADRGAPAPIICAVRGTAGSGVTGSSFTVLLGTSAEHHGRSNGIHNGFRHGRASTTSPTSLTVNFDTSTVFLEPGNPTATIGSITQGDRLIVVWRAAPGIAAVNLPAATRVIDLGH
jgi:hypothetical protein